MSNNDKWWQWHNADNIPTAQRAGQGLGLWEEKADRTLNSLLFKSWKNSWIICLSVEREQNWKHFYENVSISEMSLTLSTGNNFRESKTVPSTYQLPCGSAMIYKNIISEPFKKNLLGVIKMTVRAPWE